MRQLAVAGNDSRARPLWPLAVWVGVILLVVVPWSSFQDHSHWAIVQWVPFVTPPIKASDIVANVLLYVPLGYLGAWSRRFRAAWHVLALGLVISAATEFTQVYSHGRFPSSTDLTCNVAGAWLGLRWALRGLDRKSAGTG